MRAISYCAAMPNTALRTNTSAPIWIRIADRLTAACVDPRKSAPVWRETGECHRVTLIATSAGLSAVGIGFAVTSEKVEDRGRLCRLPAA